MNDVLIVSAARLPIGRFGGALKEVSDWDLGTIVIAEAMKRGMLAAAHAQGIIEISAGNYGGELGPFKFNLHDILSDYADQK